MAEILKTTIVELSNVNNIGPEYSVRLGRPLHLKNGSALSVTDSYISLFAGALYQPNSIVIEDDFNFTMKAACVFTNLCDNIPTNGHGTQIPMGYVSISTQSPGVMTIIDIDIKIEKGVYEPNEIVQIFNKQSCKQNYVNNYSIQNGGFTLPAVGGVGIANTVPFSSIDNVYKPNVGTTIEFSQPTLGDWDPEYGFRIEPLDDPTEYGCPNGTVFMHGSTVGLEIDFDEVQNRFFISRNFSPIISGDNNNFTVLRFQPDSGPVASLNRTYIDRAGEIFITDWGWPISTFENSFWARLGFTSEDLYKYEEYEDDKFLWGRTYAAINSLTNLMENSEYSSDDLGALKIQQGIENNGTWAAVLYDGSTLGIYAQNQPVYNPLPFLRCRLSLTTSGGFLNEVGDLGVTQLISLLNLSPTSGTSFGILNPNTFGIDGNYLVTEINIKFEDPRDGTPLKWVSKKIFSSVTLRIQEVIKNDVEDSTK